MTYSSDPEANNERTPMLGSSSQGKSSGDDDAQEKSAKGLLHVLQFFGGGIYAPDPSTYDPIEILLNEEDEERRNELTKRWRDNKLSELNFVGVVAALLAGVLTSTGSWPDILPNGQKSPWTVRTSWYTGIILSLFSLLSAADQTVRLHRLSSHSRGLENIRRLLSQPNGEKKHGSDARRKPSIAQILTWQAPVAFLTSATICMVVGMFLHVWSATAHLKQPEVWDDNTKVAIVFTTVAVVCIAAFFGAQVTLYSPVRR